MRSATGNHFPIVALVFAAFCFWLTFGAQAAAQPVASKAEQLFQEGRTLFSLDHFEEACEKFEQSKALEPSVGTSLNLGRCYIMLDRKASAFVEYNLAAAIARTSGEPDREKIARELAAEIEPELSRLNVDYDGVHPPGLTVTLNGEKLAPDKIGRVRPVDPGSYRIRAAAPGRATFETSVEVGGEGDEQAVEIPVLEEVEEGTEEIVPEAYERNTGRDFQKTIGQVLVGVGAVGVGVGVVFGVVAIGEEGDLSDDQNLCPGGRCTQAGIDAVDSARVKAHVSTIGFIGGAAVAGLGTFLWLTASGGVNAHGFAPSASPTFVGGTFLQPF